MKVESDLGFIEYKKPNMLEGLEFLGKMGLNSSSLQDENTLMQNDLYYTAQAIKHMEPFIIKLELKVGKKKITKYEEAIDSMECMAPLMEVAAKLMSFMQLEEKKRGK